MNRKKLFLGVLIALLCVGGASYWWYSESRLDKMIGQMIMTGFHGDGMGENAESFAAIEKQIKRGQVGGVILFDVDVSGLVAQGMTIPEAKKHIFSSNIKSMDQVKQLTAHLQSLAPDSVPLLIAVDQEGGNIQRLKPEHGFAPIPSAKELGTGDAETTYKTAYDLGIRLAALGINTDFAPVLDVDVNPESPAIGALMRSFSANPDIVTEHGRAFAAGLNDAGIISSDKHFPGHGNADKDSHNGLTNVTNTWRPYELEPYKNILPNASPCATVMVAHVFNQNIDTLPASLSAKTIQMIRDMGFDGVVVSDDMDMGAIVNQYSREEAIKMAINAGNDLLVFGNNLDFNKDKGANVHKTIKKFVRKGEIKKSRIKESYNRIMQMKKCMLKNSKGNRH